MLAMNRQIAESLSFVSAISLYLYSLVIIYSQTTPYPFCIGHVTLLARKFLPSRMQCENFNILTAEILRVLCHKIICFRFAQNTRRDWAIKLCEQV